MALPDRDIEAILKKFGPQIEAYLKSVGYFDLEGPYKPTDLLNKRSMEIYLKASKAKNAEVWEALEKYLYPEAEGFGKDFISVYGLKPVINVHDIATEYMATRGGQFIKKTTATDKKRLVNYIWLNSSKNERPLARQILKEPHLANIVSGHRAATIIRTERGRAIRGSSSLIAKDAGATTKTWHNVGDKRVRPSHRSLGGTKIPIDSEFPNEGMYPGAVSINCRCWLEYGFDKKVADHPHPSMSALEELYGDVTPGQKAKATTPTDFTNSGTKISTVQQSSKNMQFNDKEKEVLKEYTGHWYRGMNRYIFDGPGDWYAPAKTIKERIETLDSALSKANLSEDITVYRGIKSDRFEKMLKSYPGITDPGTVLQYDGFMSTSTDKTRAAYFSPKVGGQKQVTIEIQLPKGTNAMSVKHLSLSPDEEEILVNRNMVFEVVGTREDDYMRYLTWKAIPKK